MDTTNQQLSNRTTIEETLKTMIVEVIGEDFISLEEINLTDKLTEDLEMESIDIVQFADLVKSEYGEKSDLTQWMSSMDLNEIINLKVFEIVDFLDKELSTN